MNRIVGVVVATLLGLSFLSGCVIVRQPVPIDQREDYRQEYTYGGKDVFYHHSYLRVVNASRYAVHIVQDGIEIPTQYRYGNEAEFKVKNRLHADTMTHLLVVAYGRHGQIMGKAEKTFRFNGTGKQQVEQWVLKDWMFE